MLVQIHRRVEAGLPAEHRQQGVGAILLDDLGDDLPRDRLDVRTIGRRRVGHDGGGIRIDENDGVAFFAKRLACLGAGIIKFASLPDDDWSGADEENFLEIGAFRHSCQYPYTPLAAWHSRSFARAPSRKRLE